MSSDDVKAKLLDAISRVAEVAARAKEDVRRHAAQLAEVVADVCGGRASLELTEVVPKGEPAAGLQLLFAVTGSPSPATDLGFYGFAADGYPIRRWPSLRLQNQRPTRPTDEFITPGRLQQHFDWMVTSDDSRLVVLLALLKRQAEAGRTPAAT